MYAIIWLVLIGVVGWSIGNMAGQHQYAQILGAEPTRARSGNGNCRRHCQLSSVLVQLFDSMTESSAHANSRKLLVSSLALEPRNEKYVEPMAI